MRAPGSEYAFFFFFFSSGNGFISFPSTLQCAYSAELGQAKFFATEIKATQIQTRSGWAGTPESHQRDTTPPPPHFWLRCLLRWDYISPLSLCRLWGRPDGKREGEREGGQAELENWHLSAKKRQSGLEEAGGKRSPFIKMMYPVLTASISQ